MKKARTHISEYIDAYEAGFRAGIAENEEDPVSKGEAAERTIWFMEEQEFVDFEGCCEETEFAKGFFHAIT